MENLTKEQILKEIIECRKSPTYFSKYAKIRHPIKGIISFNLYEFQKDIIDNLLDNRFNIILKARQMGISTLSALYIAWMAIFFKEKEIVILATKSKVAKALLKKVKVMFKELPDWIRPNIISDNVMSLVLENGSSITTTTTTGDAGRSDSLSLLVVDEAAFIKGMDEVWTAIYPTLSTGGDCLALSTPNGTGNWFYKIWNDAENKKNDFKTYKLHWSKHPDRDINWAAKTKKQMTKKQWTQEYECSFIGSGDNVIDISDLIDNYKSMIQIPIETRYSNKLWIFKTPISNRKYILCGDVARGDGSDNSAFHILDAETGEQMVEFYGQVSTLAYAGIIKEWGEVYNNALVIIENNNVGWSVLDSLNESGYKNIYYSLKGQTFNKFLNPNDPTLIRNFRSVRNSEFNNVAFNEYKNNMVQGFTTSEKTRPIILEKFASAIDNQLVKLHSDRMLGGEGELMTWIWNNGRMDHESGHHDDAIMAYSFGWFVIQQLKKINASTENVDEINNIFIKAMSKKKSEEEEKRKILKQQSRFYKNKEVRDGKIKIGKEEINLDWL